MSTNSEVTVALIALGSNLGNSQQTLREAIGALEQLSAGSLRVSSLYETAPVDCPPGSLPFLNAAVALIPRAEETPETLFEKLRELEKHFGRTPKRIHNEPRSLDLDLIAFGSEVRSTPMLTLPHPRAHLREFVLTPLAEIAPDLILPGQSETVTELLARCPRQGVRRVVQ